jgi:uncharacterized repeat protein (TIGR01451 family)
MKTTKLLVNLFALALLLTSAPTTSCLHTRAIETQANLAPMPSHKVQSSTDVEGGLRHIRLENAGWHIETISLGDDTSTASLALDSLDRPHISFLDDSDALKYAWYDEGTWRIETVDNQGQMSGKGTSLSLDAMGHPHISYYDRTNHVLKYARYDGTSWYIDTVHEGGSDITSSLALDAAGHPHISYCDEGFSSPNDLKYAWHDGTSWLTETADTLSAARSDGCFPSLALDATGHPHISYYDRALCEIKYARLEGTSWLTETVDQGGEYSSIAIDAKGYPHISYEGSGLLYARYDSSGWHIETVDDTYSPGVGPHNSLEFDNHGLPRISYAQYGYVDVYPVCCYGLRYAWYDGKNWHVEILESYNEAGYSTSLALDDKNRPHIVYTYLAYYWGTGLKHARLILPPIDLNKQASPRDGLRNGDTLTYTITFTDAGLNAALWDPLPANVQYVTDSITSTVTPPAVYSPTAHAIVWQGTLGDTAQIIRFQVTPAISATGGLVPPIANTAWLTDTSRTISASAVVNGYHMYLPVALHNN